MGFIAVVGLSAGPDFVRGLQESGLSLVFAAAAVVISVQFATLMVGHFLFRMHPEILLGACAGAGTATPALAACATPKRCKNITALQIRPTAESPMY
jgi:putative transport protein